MRTKFKFYSDAGHGWLNVRKSELVKLGIADKISEGSFMKGSHAFLEEDADATKFLDALKAQGIVPVIKTHTNPNRKSKIRGYESYSYVAPVEVATGPAPVAVTPIVPTKDETPENPKMYILPIEEN